MNKPFLWVAAVMAICAIVAFDVWMRRQTPIPATTINSPPTPKIGFAPFIVKVYSVNGLSIPATTHGQGQSVFSECFNEDQPPDIVSCNYTRDAEGNLNFAFLSRFSGTIAVFAVAPTALELERPKGMKP